MNKINIKYQGGNTSFGNGYSQLQHCNDTLASNYLFHCQNTAGESCQGNINQPEYAYRACTYEWLEEECADHLTDVFTHCMCANFSGVSLEGEVVYMPDSSNPAWCDPRGWLFRDDAGNELESNCPLLFPDDEAVAVTPGCACQGIPMESGDLTCCAYPTEADCCVPDFECSTEGCNDANQCDLAWNGCENCPCPASDCAGECNGDHFIDCSGDCCQVSDGDCVFDVGCECGVIP